ncbi:TetR/AcrR family transcriptional regulator [Nocardia fusca]|uniref:TetR/AcrR family transcriptional regulator n=1 Tax=Nocardia fusca TaxID=941183 RepID=A0ABV3FFC8_9NOCA
MPVKQRRGEETKQRLLDAALTVHEQGEFTVQAVQLVSGVSLGSLYHHFGSFDGLAAALHARCLAELLDGVVIELERASTARTGVTAVVTAYITFVMDQPTKARFLHSSANAAYLPAYADMIAETKRLRMTRIESWLAPHIAAGSIEDLTDSLTEILLIGPVAELSRRWLTGAEIDLARTAELLPPRIWAALRAGG